MTAQSTSQLTPWERNPRTISEKARAGLKKSYLEFGDLSGIVFNIRNKRLVSGHQRTSILPQDSTIEIERRYEQPTRTGTVAEGSIIIDGERYKYREVDWDETRHAAANIAANSESISGEYTDELVKLLDELKIEAPDISEDLNFDILRLDHKDLWENDSSGKNGTLQEKFIVPPFSIFDTRQKYWMDRKEAWLSLGIESELGRENDLTYSDSSQSPGIYNLRNSMRQALGRDPNWKEIFEEAKRQGINVLNSTSTFDPVLAEIMYAWFNIEEGKILDPFAGGSVRGIVAERLGYHYYGIELRKEQIEANRRQASAMKLVPYWIEGDARNVLEIIGQEQFDFIFSCPPYFDLEIYSDDPRDLSNFKTYEEFLIAYQQIIRDSLSLLKPNRFACFVVSDIRDKKGLFRDFIGDTVGFFRQNGAELYNSAILINQLASLPIRVSQFFPVSRKLGKTHQNVLVFYKGDPEAIRLTFKPTFKNVLVDDDGL